MLPLISINGQLVDRSLAQISPFDRGFTLGDGIFETLKVTHGAPWYLGRHLQRLRHSAEIMGIPYVDDVQNWIGDVVHRVQTEGVHEFTLRVTVTRGATERAGISVDGTLTPTVTVIAYPAPTLDASMYDSGISIQIAHARRNDRSMTVQCKTTNFAEAIVALRQAREGGFDDVIFLNTYDFVAEASTSNVFVSLNGALVTPAPTQGILPGITRAVLLELAARTGISTAEREINRYELLNADEVFLTSSIRGIVPVVKIDDTTIGRGAPGELTHTLMRTYESASDRI